MLPVDVLTRGQQISTAIAAVTSTAISPLLGVTLLGLYDYARAEPEARASLPFYSHPYFWIPIGVLLVLIFFKDTIGGMFPLLKKPLDAIEILVVNKAALVLIAFPVMFDEVAKLTGIPDIPAVQAASPGMADSAGHLGAAMLMLTAGTLITLVVWVVGHAADVVALVMPIPYLDLAVKASRAVVLLAVAGCAVLSPTLGLIASGIVIAICALLFCLALRVVILGTVFAWDVLAGGTRARVDGSAVRVFTLGKNPGMPRHTLGQLARRPDGALEFRYRRMVVGPLRRVRLGDGSVYEVGRGLMYPSVVRNGSIQLRLLPRYCGSEEEVRAALGMSGVRDVGLGKLFGRAEAPG